MHIDPIAKTEAQRRRWLWWTAAGVGVLVILAIVGLRMAAQGLHGALVEALGPRSEIGELTLGWTGVEATQVRIRAAGGRAWPAGDELHARRVRVVPALRTLFSSGWHIARVEVDDGYISLLRSRDGRLHVLPALLERDGGAKPRPASSRTPEPPSAALRVVIGQVVLRNTAVEFYDASVRQPPLRLRLQELDAQIGPLDLPALDVPTEIELDAVVKGVLRDGKLALRGDIVFATRDSKLDARLQGVDLLALQPYLVKVSEAGVRQGTLDLRLRSTVVKNHLHAPGELKLSGLELANTGGVLGTFAGVPRQAVLAFLSRNERIEVDFTLEGRLDDPNFSLNENLATRIASALADKLGVSLGGVVEGVGSVIKGLFGK